MILNARCQSYSSEILHLSQYSHKENLALAGNPLMDLTQDGSDKADPYSKRYHLSPGDGWTTQTSIVLLEFHCKLQFNAASDLTAVDSLYRLSEPTAVVECATAPPGACAVLSDVFQRLKTGLPRVYHWILLYLALSWDSRLQCSFHGTRANRVQPVPFPSRCCTVSTAAYFKPKQECERNKPPSPHRLALPCF